MNELAWCAAFPSATPGSCSEIAVGIRATVSSDNWEQTPSCVASRRDRLNKRRVVGGRSTPPLQSRTTKFVLFPQCITRSTLFKPCFFSISKIGSKVERLSVFVCFRSIPDSFRDPSSFTFLSMTNPPQLHLKFRRRFDRWALCMATNPTKSFLSKVSAILLTCCILIFFPIDILCIVCSSYLYVCLIQAS